MKPRLIFFLAPKSQLTTFSESKFYDELESEIEKIRKIIKRKKVDINSLQVIYTKDENNQQKIIAQNIICEIGSYPSIGVETMFSISTHIISNQLPYEVSFFDKNKFALFSEHNRKLICNIIEQSLAEIPETNFEVIIFLVSQKYLEKEWPYYPSFWDMVEANFNNTQIKYSPILVDLKLKSITCL